MSGNVELAADVEIQRRLSLLWSLSPRQIRRLSARLEDGAATWSEIERGKFPPGIRIGEALRRSVAEEVRSWGEVPPADRLKQWGADQIRLCVRGEQTFPQRLLQIPDPPSHLFHRGPYWCDRHLLRRPRVGIIGSRAASTAGLEIARRLARDLALAECVVVSGLARGIDGAAHRGALDAGGVSAAVLGSGPDVAYPHENADVFERILRTGGLVSEFPPGTPPLPYHFPRRNRLLAGWVDLLVVVEGGERSGARSTVDHALDQGREVAAVPRDVLLEGSALPNRLLFDGARLVRSCEDILSLLESLPSRTDEDLEPWSSIGDLGGTRDSAGLGSTAVGGDSVGPEIPENDHTSSMHLRHTILRFLEAGASTSDELSEKIESTPWSEIRTALTELEIRGVVERLPGDRLRRRREG